MPVGSRVPFEGIDHDDAHLGFPPVPSHVLPHRLDRASFGDAFQPDSGTSNRFRGFLQDPGEALFDRLGGLGLPFWASCKFLVLRGRDFEVPRLRG